MQLLETAAGKASGDVGKQFDAAIANNLTTVRMFGFGTMGGFALQSSIGSYNEQAFQAFDKVSTLKPGNITHAALPARPTAETCAAAGLTTDRACVMSRMQLRCHGAVPDARGVPFCRSLMRQPRGGFA